MDDIKTLWRDHLSRIPTLKVVPEDPELEAIKKEMNIESDHDSVSFIFDSVILTNIVLEYADK